MNDITQLVKMALNGDRAAFDSLYEQTKSSVWFTCISLLKNEENAKDIMQDTYLAAFDKLDTLESHAAFKTWLNKIAANKCKNFLVAKANSAVESNSEEILEKIPDDKFLPEEYVTDAEKRRIIMDIIEDVLSANQYRTIILYYFDEMSVAEIAELMECHEKTVQYRLKTARIKIKEEITRYEEESRDKLHAAAPFVPLTTLFGTHAESVSVPPVPAVHIPTPEPPSALTVPSDQAATAVNTGGKAMLNTLKAKIIAGACAAAVVGGGVTAGVLIANNSKDKPPESRPSVSTPANSSKPAVTSKPAASSTGSTSKPVTDTSKPTTSESEVPAFEGLKPVELLRFTDEFGVFDPDIISGSIKDAYMTNSGSFILLTEDGELLLYKSGYGGYTPISLGKDTGITKLESILFKADNIDMSLTVTDGKNVFFKATNAEGEVKLSRDGNERAAQGVLFEGRAVREICVDMYLEILYVIDEDGNGLMLENRFMLDQEYTDERGVFVDESECFFYFPERANSFYYNGMKVKQRAGNCILAEDDKIYFHDPGHSDLSEAPIEVLKDIDFERIFHSGSNIVFDSQYYAGVTKDGRITALNIKENDEDNNADAEIVFSDDLPDGDIQKVWLNDTRIVVKTDKGCYYAKYDEDDALKPLDALNALDEDVVYLRGDTVLLSSGYLYKINAFKN